MSEDQLYDAAEREMDLYRAEVTRVMAERDAAMAEARKVRDVLALVLSRFSQTGNGCKASARVVELARWHDETGIERPQELRDVK